MTAEQRELSDEERELIRFDAFIAAHIRQLTEGFWSKSNQLVGSAYYNWWNEIRRREGKVEKIIDVGKAEVKGELILNRFGGPDGNTDKKGRFNRERYGEHKHNPFE